MELTLRIHIIEPAFTPAEFSGERSPLTSVQRSTKFEFVINFKTAKALGIEVPNSMQLLATEVID